MSKGEGLEEHMEVEEDFVMENNTKTFYGKINGDNPTLHRIDLLPWIKNKTKQTKPNQPSRL